MALPPWPPAALRGPPQGGPSLKAPTSTSFKEHLFESNDTALPFGWLCAEAVGASLERVGAAGGGAVGCERVRGRGAEPHHEEARSPITKSSAAAPAHAAMPARAGPGLGVGGSAPAGL